jgi:HSP20 family molecular chaperone IbpA
MKACRINSPHSGKWSRRAGRPFSERRCRDLMGFDPFQNLRPSYGFDYDVSRNESGYEVEVPVPGYSAEQVDVSLKDGF